MILHGFAWRSLKHIVCFIKKRCLEVRKIFLKNELLKKIGVQKTDFFMKCLDDSAWFCVEEHQQTLYLIKKRTWTRKFQKESGRKSL